MNEIKTIIEMLGNQAEKMKNDGSWIIGSLSGIFSVAVPKWVMDPNWSVDHTILIGVLIILFILEFLVGRRLAKSSDVVRKTSGIGIDAAIRDFIILSICMIAYGFDHMLSLGSILFVIVTAAFIYHNLYSLLANIYVLGWDKHFPMWLFNYLQDEIEVKKEKYFPEKKDTK